MSDTLIDIINRIRQSVGSRGNKTAISETDGTAFLRDKINEALIRIYGWGPSDTNTDGTVTLPVATRTVNGPTGLDLARIHHWSWRINDTAGDIPLEQVTKQFIIEQFPSYETEQGVTPQYVYLEGQTIGFYPLVLSTLSSLTIQFSYPAQLSRLAATTDTIIFPDTSDEMRYIELYAKRAYEIEKGLGQPGVTNEDMDDMRDKLKAKYRKSKRVGITGHRKYGR